MLALSDVTKTYPGGSRAVDGLSLDVASGELVVLVGPSGCGKTTTLRLVAGLERPDDGHIALDGQSTKGVAPKDRDVAMVFQGHALYPHLNVAGNMGFGLRLRRVPRIDIRRRVAEAAALLGIAELLDRRPGELSGGQQQRVALGRALVRSPKLFLFDEPLSSLDAALRAQLRQEIRQIHARTGTTMLYVTHDQTEAMTLGQRIAVMREGRLEQVADPATIYARPANRFVARLIGHPPMNLFDGRIERRDGRTVFVAGDNNPAGNNPGTLELSIPEVCAARLASFDGGPIALGIRPEHLRPSTDGLGPDCPRMAGKVEAVELLGPESHVYLAAGGQTIAARMAPGHGPRIGEEVGLAMAAEGIHFFDAESGQRLA